MKETFQLIYDAAVEKSKNLEDTGEIFELWNDIWGIFSSFAFHEGIYHRDDEEAMFEMAEMDKEKAKFYQLEK